MIWVVVPVRQAGNRFLGSLKGLQIQAQSMGVRNRVGIGLSKKPARQTTYASGIESWAP
jgi:hypothetical protein